MSITSYTATGNTTVSGISIATGMSPASVDNALRKIVDDIGEALRNGYFATAIPSTKTANFAVTTANRGAMFECTDALTITLPAAATAEQGFMFYAKASGGDITLDGDGTELVNGAETCTVQGGESVIVACTGTAWTTYGTGVSAASRRNILDNGNFDIWQRGATVTVTAALPAIRGVGSDRWVVRTATGGDNVQITRQTFTLGQTDVPGSPKYYQRVQRMASTGGGVPWFLCQAIEDVTATAGKQYTLTLYVKGGAATDLTVDIDQNFGSGGSPSGTVTQSLADITVTTSWQKVQYVFTPASVSGKTLGTDGKDHLFIRIAQKSGTTNLTQPVDFAHVSLVQGDLRGIADPFVPKSKAEELAACGRYYQASGSTGALSLFNGGVTNGAAYRSAPVRFSPTMRSSSVVVTLTNAANISFSSTVGTVSANEVGFYEVRTATATAGGLYLSEWTATDDLGAP